MDSVRGHNRAPGEFRKMQVHIGVPGAPIEQAKFIPPPPTETVRLFANLEKYINSDDVIDPLVQIAIAHYQFESIHPFMDGNGRVGRLLVPLFLYEKKITAYPNIYVSEFLEEHRSEYYDLLNGVSEKGAWLPWISFFLNAITQQTLLTQERVRKIENLYKSLKERLFEFNSVYAISFMDAIFQNPRFTVKGIKKTTGIQNNQTLYTLVGKFLNAGIIHDLTKDQDRNKEYLFKSLRDIIS